MSNDDNDNDFVKRIVGDLYLVATYVASQPAGYAGFEADRARVLLHTVDPSALKDTLNSVLFVSDYNRWFAPLTETEAAIEQAALRLDGLRRTIQMNQQAIQARMAA